VVDEHFANVKERIREGFWGRGGKRDTLRGSGSTTTRAVWASCRFSLALFITHPLSRASSRPLAHQLVFSVRYDAVGEWRLLLLFLSLSLSLSVSLSLFLSLSLLPSLSQRMMKNLHPEVSIYTDLSG